MAKGKITFSDSIDQKVFEIGTLLADSLGPGVDKVVELDNAFKALKVSALGTAEVEKQFKISKSRKEFLEIKKKEAELSKKVAEAQVAEQKIKQSLLDTEKKGIDVEVKKQRQKNSTISLTAKEKYELQLLNKGKREAALLSSALSTEYEKQSVRLTQLRRKYKDVALVEGESSVNAKRLRTEILQLDTALKRVDANVGQFQRSVGNYSKAMTSAGRAARNLAGAMGFVGGSFLFIQVMRDAFKRVREFDKSMQNLAGVFRTTRSELAPLEAKIIDVAGASVKTSREVADLAEKLATLGKTPDQIEKLLKPVNDLGIGLNTTGEEAGTFLVQMLNAFGASDDEAQKYADTIATIRTSTTLDFQKMRDSFQYIAPISRILNKDIAYTGAVVGILSDNSIKAEQAGRLLGTAQQRLATKGISLIDALGKINVAQDKGIQGTQLLSIASKLFGIQAAKIGIILANNTDKIEKNAQAIRDNGGALDDLVKEQLKALDAKLKILDASWEKLILTVENGKGSIANSFKDFIGFVTTLIQKTTDLETAQSRVFEITGQKKGWFDFLKKSSVLTTFLGSDYDKLVKIQEKFDKQNKTLDNNSLDVLKTQLESVRKEWGNTNNISEDATKLYLNQAKYIQGLIDKREKENASIRATAKELKYEGEAYDSQGKFISKQYENVEKASIRELKIFIANKKKREEAETNANLESEKARKEREKKEKKALQDSLALNTFTINQKINAEREYAKDENNSFEERKKALINASKLELSLAYDTATAKLLLQKNFSTKEIDTILSGGKISKNLQKKLNDEEFLIVAQYQAKKNEIKKGTDTSLDSLSIEKLKADSARKASIKERDLNNELALEDEAFRKKQGIYANAENAIELREKRIAEIKKKYALEGLNAQVSAIETLLKASGLSAEKRAEYEKQLASLKLGISKITTADFIENSTKEVDLTKQKNDKIKELSNQLKDALMSLGNAIFESKIQAVEDEIAANDEKYNKILSNENLTDEQRKRLEAKREVENAKLEKKKREEQRKQAIFNKASAALNIAISTSQAIISALAQVPKFDFGISASAIAAAYAGIGALQLAAVLAAPLPKYKLGRGKGKSEFAEVGDGFVHEVVEKSDGSAYLTPNKPTVTYLEHDDIVHSNVNDYLKGKSTKFYNELFKATAMASIDIDAKKAKEHEKLLIINNRIDEAILEQAILKSGKNIEDRVVRAINKSILSSKTVNNINVEYPTKYNKF